MKKVIIKYIVLAIKFEHFYSLFELSLSSEVSRVLPALHYSKFELFISIKLLIKKENFKYQNLKKKYILF